MTNTKEADNRFAHWKISFPRKPIQNTMINRLPKGWTDSSFPHDEAPSILWKVGKMDCCQLYIDEDKLSLLDWKDNKWTHYSLRESSDIFFLCSMIEWYLLRLRAFEDFTSHPIKVISANTIDEKVGDFCDIYFTYRKDLGNSAMQYWPGEIIGEVQKSFGFED